MAYTGTVQVSRHWTDANQEIEDYLQSLAESCVAVEVADASSPSGWFATHFSSINPERCDFLTVHTDADRIFWSTDGGTTWVEVFNVTIITISTGSIVEYAGDDSNIPSGWQLCDGLEINRTTYAALYAVQGDTFGNGNGSTTFNLPDMRHHAPMGVNNAGLPNGADGGKTTRDIGDEGGTETHVLVTAELAAHLHANDRGGTNTVTFTSGETIKDASGGGGTVGNTGSDTGHNNLHPHTTLNYIIKDGT